MSEPTNDMEQKEVEASSEENPPILPSAEPPAPWPEKPGVDSFERWLQKYIFLKLGSVIVIAFLFKSFVPIDLGFTVGLLTGVILLVLIYLVDFNRRKQAGG